MSVFNMFWLLKNNVVLDGVSSFETYSVKYPRSALFMKMLIFNKSSLKTNRAKAFRRPFTPTPSNCCNIKKMTVSQTQNFTLPVGSGSSENNAMDSEYQQFQPSPTSFLSFQPSVNLQAGKTRARSDEGVLELL